MPVTAFPAAVPPPDGPPRRTSAAEARTAGPEQPVSTLRGAGVAVDPKVVGRVVVAVVLLGVAALAVGLIVAGAQNNSRIDRLRHDGTRVPITVTHCIALLGGSGTNAAGYACQGAYTLGGRRYDVSLPGDSLLTQGSTIAGVAVPADPSLFPTQAVLRTEQATWRVFVVPVLLLLAVAAVVAALVLRRRRAGERSAAGAAHGDA